MKNNTNTCKGCEFLKEIHDGDSYIELKCLKKSQIGKCIFYAHTTYDFSSSIAEMAKDKISYKSPWWCYKKNTEVS